MSEYCNPVYPHACPDPFVLQYCGEYWAYYTGIQPDGRAFGILHSPDLVHWRAVGSALDLLPGENPCYWAPEVTYHNGEFYLYYAVGDEDTMHLRVARSPHPAGPFVDSGRRLTQEPFAIDAHVFIDEDGQWYLFYACDFLDYARVGTGTVVDRLLDPLTPAGEPRPVTRARYDWQIYDPQRAAKGGVCWHTLEGPFVLKHEGQYYQMFSGGNWQNSSYGVGYAVSPTLLAEGEWAQRCDGGESLPVLRSRPEIGVVGPGHNSVVAGPDNRQLYCVYHRWLAGADGKGERVLAIDPLRWEAGRLVVDGPSTTPQPWPAQPQLRVSARADALIDLPARFDVLEVWLRVEPPPTPTRVELVETPARVERGLNGLDELPPSTRVELVETSAIAMKGLNGLDKLDQRRGGGSFEPTSTELDTPSTRVELRSENSVETPAIAMKGLNGLDKLDQRRGGGSFAPTSSALDLRAEFGLTIDGPADTPAWRISIQPGRRRVLLQAGAHMRACPLPADFNPQAYHRLRVEHTAGGLTAWLDGIALNGPMSLPASPQAARLFSAQCTANFTAVAVT